MQECGGVEWDRCEMIQLRSICLSAHLDSFCRCLNDFAGLEFVYQSDDPGAMRRKVGWKLDAQYRNGPQTRDSYARAQHCDILIEMLREMPLMLQRANEGRKTVYVSERWLKPLVIKGIRFPGIFRLLSPSYFRMVKKFCKLMDNENFWVFACGVHAARDFARLYGLFHGDLCCLFKTPAVKVEKRLGGGVGNFRRLKVWGYFVEPSKPTSVAISSCESDVLKIFWCGRMLDWKCVDDLVVAFDSVCKKRPAALLVVGEGEERGRLQTLAGTRYAEGLTWTKGLISFNNYVSGDKVRELMRLADVYVMPSNEEEGWGAAVSDALTEGCGVISTYEAGSSATLLDDDALYHCRDVHALAQKLIDFKKGCQTLPDMNLWSGAAGARTFMEVVK